MVEDNVHRDPAFDRDTVESLGRHAKLRRDGDGG